MISSVVDFWRSWGTLLARTSPPVICCMAVIDMEKTDIDLYWNLAPRVDAGIRGLRFPDLSWLTSQLYTISRPIQVELPENQAINFQSKQSYSRTSNHLPKQVSHIPIIQQTTQRKDSVKNTSRTCYTNKTSIFAVTMRNSAVHTDAKCTVL